MGAHAVRDEGEFASFIVPNLALDAAAYVPWPTFP
jgi:hypothetical protein